MFHLFDSPVNDTANGARASWMALLARAPVAVLEAGLGERAGLAAQWLRPPETGLMMVQGRAGGSGERFNLGEVTVTRCALRLAMESGAQPAVGVAYVLGRQHQRARLAALADALLQDPARQAALDAALLQPIREHLAQQAARRSADAQATRVEFFTVAREAGATDAEDSE